jgi:dihydroxyacetone kinase-like protein
MKEDHTMSEEIDAKEMAKAIIAAIEKNKGWLSEIDGAIGDGDHGINMAKGLGQAGQKLDQTPDSVSDVLKFLGMTLLTNIGGAMGPIYGTLFMRMGKELEGKQRIEKQDLQKMLDGALEGVKARGKAEVGEKTLVDALQPARDEYERAVASGKTMKEAIGAMIDGARGGMERTKDMVARKGRSSRLGERSKGTIDAGAASCYVILSAMGEYLKKYAD